MTKPGFELAVADVALTGPDVMMTGPGDALTEPDVALTEPGVALTESDVAPMEPDVDLTHPVLTFSVVRVTWHVLLLPIYTSDPAHHHPHIQPHTILRHTTKRIN